MKNSRRKFFKNLMKGTAIVVAAPLIVNELLSKEHNSVWPEETLQALKDRRDYLKENPDKIVLGDGWIKQIRDSPNSHWENEESKKAREKHKEWMEAHTGYSHIWQPGPHIMRDTFDKTGKLLKKEIHFGSYKTFNI